MTPGRPSVMAGGWPESGGGLSMKAEGAAGEKAERSCVRITKIFGKKCIPVLKFSEM